MIERSKTSKAKLLYGKLVLNIYGLILFKRLSLRYISFREGQTLENEASIFAILFMLRFKIDNPAYIEPNISTSDLVILGSNSFLISNLF